MQTASPNRPSVAGQPATSVRGVAIFLAVTHAAGVLGYLHPISRPWFQWVTPLHLLMTVALLLYFHRDWRSSFGLFAASVALVGYWVEVLGVQTSLIFGDYAYDTTLGVKVLDVPLMIGVNWLLVTYLCGSVCHRLPIKTGYRIVLAALLMVGIDLLIEPVAITYDFWHWKTGSPPLHNYVGWFGTAVITQLLFFTLPFRKSNALALPLLLIQGLFYISLQLF